MVRVPPPPTPVPALLKNGQIPSVAINPSSLNAEAAISGCPGGGTVSFLGISAGLRVSQGIFLEEKHLHADTATPRALNRRELWASICTCAHFEPRGLFYSWRPSSRRDESLSMNAQGARWRSVLKTPGDCCWNGSCCNYLTRLFASGAPTSFCLSPYSSGTRPVATSPVSDGAASGHAAGGRLSWPSEVRRPQPSANRPP